MKNESITEGWRITDYVFKTESTIGDRRSTQINATISAAIHGGLNGLGYGISDPENVINKDIVEGKRYYREKMISVLALIEEVGLIGMGLFLAIIGYVFWGLINAKGKILNNKLEIINVKLEAAFMIAVLIGLSFNAQIEGWWLGAGSWQFLLFFMFLGLGFGRMVGNG